ncbi:MAG: carboxymuconolactone decarboxylase family protein [Acidobacteriota bacterium]
MEARINTRNVAYMEGIQALLGVQHYIEKSGLEQSLLDLVVMRASQINGCAYCLDMHWKDAKASGETDQRLYGLDAWEESPYYTKRERAALHWAEAVTKLTESHVPDEAFEAVRKEFSEKEIVDLTIAIGMINLWNRLNIANRTVPGKYVSPRKPVPAEAMAASR